MEKHTKNNFGFLYHINSLGIKEVSLSGIRIERLEDRIDPKVPFPHKHDFYQLIVITEGRGVHQIDFVKHAVTSSSLFLMKPGQVHSWTLTKKVKGIMIEFNRDVFSKELKSLNQVLAALDAATDTLSIKNSGDRLEVQKIAVDMLSEAQQPRPFTDIALPYMLSLFLIRVLRLTEVSSGVRKSEDKGNRFKKLVEENFKRHHRVEFYSEMMASTSKAFTMQMTRQLGRSPRAIIQERILLEAKRMLAFSNLGVAEIGFELGFDDANYFTRFFRTHEKLSPAVFRRKFFTAHS